jgi:hypothetical protein
MVNFKKKIQVTLLVSEYLKKQCCKEIYKISGNMGQSRKYIHSGQLSV